MCIMIDGGRSHEFNNEFFLIGLHHNKPSLGVVITTHGLLYKSTLTNSAVLIGFFETFVKAQQQLNLW